MADQTAPSTPDNDEYTPTDSQESTPEYLLPPSQRGPPAPSTQQAPRSHGDDYFTEHIPRELRDKMMDEINAVSIVPAALTRPERDAPLPRDLEEPLLYITNSRFLSVNRLTRAEHISLLKGKVLRAEIPRVTVHVHNFDFSLLISHFLSRLNAQQRLAYNAAGHTPIHIILSVTNSLDLMPDNLGLEAWLNWRKAEIAAGRHVECTYSIIDDAVWRQKYRAWRADDDFEGRPVTRGYERKMVNSKEGVERLLQLLFPFLTEGTSDGPITQDIRDIMAQMNPYIEKWQNMHNLVQQSDGIIVLDHPRIRFLRNHNSFFRDEAKTLYNRL